MNKEKIIRAARKAVKEWREWHKPEYGTFPHDELIKAMGEMELLFPGKTVKEICDEADHVPLVSETDEADRFADGY